MKKQTSYIPSLVFLFIIFLCPALAAAQEIDKILLPAEEGFQKVDAVASAWYYTSCVITHQTFINKDCQLISGSQADMVREFNLYNSDGSLWYNFSNNPNDRNHLPKRIKAEFKPLVLDTERVLVILRMVRESKHWYEVEINEESRETKYLLKTAPMMWAKISWEHWLYIGRDAVYLSDNNYVYADPEKRELLRDAPNGKIIEKRGEFDKDSLKFLKLDGDWAYVRAWAFTSPGSPETKELKGWIRWREGREFLVGCIFNNFKIQPKTKGDNEQAVFSKP